MKSSYFLRYNDNRNNAEKSARLYIYMYIYNKKVRNINITNENVIYKMDLKGDKRQDKKIYKKTSHGKIIYKEIITMNTKKRRRKKERSI